MVISDKLKSPVRCRFEAGKVLLSAKTGNGEAKDICRLEGDGDGLEIGFNCRYILDALRAVPNEEVCLEMRDGLSPLVFTPVDEKEDYAYMVLPVRLKAGS